MKIATRQVNGINGRLNVLLRWLELAAPDIVCLVVMMYVRFPLSLRHVEDLLFERGIGICHEAVRYWWNRLVLSDQMHRLVI